MLIGIPKEVKVLENRVAITPAGVVTLVAAGHKVIIETNAGNGANFYDELYIEAGAQIVATAKEAWDVEMVLKVKEPIEQEYAYFRDGLILFTYLHLAADRALTEALLAHRVTAIAYETIQLEDRSLPLLSPMSEVAGRMATQIGAQYLEKIHGGKGILLSGVPGVERGKVAIIGGGQAGENAAKIAVGMGAQVTLLDINPAKLRELDNQFGAAVQTLMSNSFTIAKAVAEADLVVGAVLIPGAKAPKLVTDDMVQAMAKGSVIVDVAIDQGGIFETSDHVTTHDHPTYTKHGVIHYAVGNMPGAVPRTATLALTNNTIPYALQLANLGVEKAIDQNQALSVGMNTYQGNIVYEQVAKAHNLPYLALQTSIGV